MSFFHAIYGNALQDIQGTAEVTDVLDGKTFQSRYSYDYKVGTMTNKEGMTVESNDVTQDNDDALIGIPVRACYNTNSKIKVPIETLKNNLTGLAPEPIGGFNESIDLNVVTDLSSDVLDSLTSANFLGVPNSLPYHGYGSNPDFRQDGYNAEYYINFSIGATYNQSTHIVTVSAMAYVDRHATGEGSDERVDRAGSRTLTGSVYLLL